MMAEVTARAPRARDVPVIPERDVPVIPEKVLEHELVTHPLRRLNRRAAAAFCGVSLDMMRRLEKAGELVPVRKTGGSCFYLLGDLMRINAGDRVAEFGGRPRRDRTPSG